MKCPKCQSQNPEGKKFCGKCGASLSSTCPHCGAVVPPEDSFCGECGQSLSAPSSATPPEPAPSPSSERKRVTVLFSDLSGYTAMSEKLDPEEVKAITTRIFGEVAKIVDRYEGFVEKYIGDAVVALFGVPKAHEDDHLRAIRAAQEIHALVEGMGSQYQERIGRRLTFHTGVATGLVVTGEVNLEKGTHGVAGDTINLASRLSGLAKPGEILVGESTHLQSKGTFSFEGLQPASVKGKAEPVIPYRLLEEKEEPSRGLAAQGLTSPLVGRTAEIAAIKGCVNRLLDGQGGILSLIGEAGLGKSRIMAEIRHAFVHENLLWLEGKTLSYGQKMSYWPFREILWQYAGISEDDGTIEAWDKFETRIVDLFPDDSGEILPYLASLIGLEVKGERAKDLAHVDGESMGKQIYFSSRRFFERLGATAPLVLVFEDLHWADESTILLIEHLFPLINRVPLLICGVTRPETGIPAMRLRDTALKDHERRYTEIRLSPLSPTECTDLMNNLLAIENLPSRTRQLILTRADGNPFFLEEIMRTLVDGGAVHPENGRWRATAAIDTVTIPDTIQGVIMARIDRLDQEVKQVLKTASVIGRAFLYRVLRTIEGAIENLDKDLDRLTETELIREKQKVPELEYIFKHALVQESTYESILLKKRLELHAKVAAAIEQLFSERLDELSSVLAYHYAKAESWEKAQEYLFKAGDQAGRIAADAEALTHYQQALETYAKAFGDRWDPVQRGILERKMGEAFYRRGDYQNAMEYLQRALVYFGRPMLPTSRAGIGLGILREILVQVAHRLFSPWLVKKTYGPVDQAEEEVALIYWVVQGIDSVTTSQRLLLTSFTSLNFSERKGYAPGVVQGYSFLAFVAFWLSLPGLSEFFLQRTLALIERLQDQGALPGSAVAWFYFSSTVTGFYEGRLKRAIDHGSKVAEEGRRGSYYSKDTWPFAVMFVALAYLYEGDFGKALAFARELIHFGEDGNDRNSYNTGLLTLGDTQERTGEFEAAVTTLKKVIELSEAMMLHESRVWDGYVLGRCYLRLGELEKSLDALTETHKWGTTHKVKGFNPIVVSLGFVEVYLAAAEQAVGSKRKDWLRKAGPVCKKLLRLAKVKRLFLPQAIRLQGKYEWLRGKTSSAKECWEGSQHLAEKMGMRYEAGMIHLEMGRCLNDRDHLQKAETIFADIGAEWDLEQARRYLQPLAERKEA
jgi:class 3 adenylate cyclase/tetratricopeptide (TPR) repeat protein